MFPEDEFKFSGYLIVEAYIRNQEEGVPVPYRQISEKKRKSIGNSWYYFGLAGEIGFAVALPIAGGALLGSRIDIRMQSYPKYTIILLFVGIAISMINFIMVIQNILKRQHT